MDTLAFRRLCRLPSAFNILVGQSDIRVASVDSPPNVCPPWVFGALQTRARRYSALFARCSILCILFGLLAPPKFIRCPFACTYPAYHVVSVAETVLAVTTTSDFPVFLALFGKGCSGVSTYLSVHLRTSLLLLSISIHFLGRTVLSKSYFTFCYLWG